VQAFPFPRFLVSPHIFFSLLAPPPPLPPRMSGPETDPNPPPVDWKGTTYKPLADGKYDVIILGTGLKECILSGLLSVKGKKVRGAARCESGSGQRDMETEGRCLCVCVRGLRRAAACPRRANLNTS
jgi:hypothetical protein